MLTSKDKLLILELIDVKISDLTNMLSMHYDDFCFGDKRLPENQKRMQELRREIEEYKEIILRLNAEL